MSDRHPSWDTPEGRAASDFLGVFPHKKIEELAEGMGLSVVNGALRIKPISNHFYIDIHFMTFGNRRLVMAGRAGHPIRGWCYRGPTAFVLAYLSALEWPLNDLEWTPDGWFKDPFSGECREEWENPGLEGITRLTKIYAKAREERADEGEES